MGELEVGEEEGEFRYLVVKPLQLRDQDFKVSANPASVSRSRVPR